MAKDWRGNEYEVGSKVLYGRAVGSHGIELVEAEVTAIRPTTITVRPLRSAEGSVERSVNRPWHREKVVLHKLANVTAVR